MAAQDDRIANGATLTDLAKELNLPVQETPPLTADGGVFGKPGMMAPEQLAPIVKAAYGMDQAKKPQLTQLVPGKTFILFDVGTHPCRRPALLAEIRPQVITDIQLSAAQSWRKPLPTRSRRSSKRACRSTLRLPRLA